MQRADTKFYGRTADSNVVQCNDPKTLNPNLKLKPENGLTADSDVNQGNNPSLRHNVSSLASLRKSRASPQDQRSC